MYRVACVWFRGCVCLCGVRLVCWCLYVGVCVCSAVPKGSFANACISVLANSQRHKGNNMETHCGREGQRGTCSWVSERRQQPRATLTLHGSVGVRPVGEHHVHVVQLHPLEAAPQSCRDRGHRDGVQRINIIAAAHFYCDGSVPFSRHFDRRQPLFFDTGS